MKKIMSMLISAATALPSATLGDVTGCTMFGSNMMGGNGMMGMFGAGLYGLIYLALASFVVSVVFWYTKDLISPKRKTRKRR